MPDPSFLGSPLPLIQAPMAGAQDARLALAAGRAGALGSLPAAMLGTDALQRELSLLHAAGGPYNVNFFAHVPPAPDPARDARWQALLEPYRAELGLVGPPDAAPSSRRPFGPDAAEVLEAFRPAVVSFHFGLPAAPLLARLKALGSLVLSTATTVNEARWLQAHGVDAVIAQGLEAGGHRGHFLDIDPARQAPLEVLLPAMVSALDIPVIAAGGIADAAGVRAALQRGAAAVLVGTTFLLCTEATTSALHRARLRDPASPTVLTNLFSGGLARGLVNRLVRDIGPVNAAAPPFPLAASEIAPLRARAEALGLDHFTPLWSGSNRSGCREVPAAEIVQALAAGFAG
jgi:nitronate monooxygenase